MFEGKRVFIVGCGPSLVGFDFSRLKSEKVMAVNHAYKLCSHDVHVFYDRSFLDEAKPDGYEPYKHAALVLAGVNTNIEAREGSVKLFRKAAGVTQAFKNGLYCGYSSTLAAINAALIWGASEVYLLGCDARFLSADELKQAAKLNGNERAAADFPSGAHHVTQNNTRHTQAENEKKYENMVSQFNAYNTLPVWNLSPFSALKIKRKTLDDVFGRSKQSTFSNTYETKNDETRDGKKPKRDEKENKTWQQQDG